MGSPWGIGITMRFPKHPQYSYIPKHPQFGYIQAHTQTISISRGGGTKHPQYSYIPKNPQFGYTQAHTQTIGISEGSTKYPQYSYIQAHTKKWYFRGEPNTRSIRIFRHRPNTLYPKGENQMPAVFVYSGIDQTRGISEGGGTKYPQYSYIQAQTKQLPEYTNNVVFGVHPLA